MEDATDLAVDDLFNESALDIPLATDGRTPPQPVSSTARQHLDDLHLYGCNQKIAWSRQGCIASVSPDASTVNIQHLHFVSSSGIWDLTVRRPLQKESAEAADAQSTLFPDYGVCHIAWGTSGTELAVVDVLGRVRIWTMTPAMTNRFVEDKARDLDLPGELRRAVGLFWFTSAGRVTQAVTHFSKMGDHWTPIVARRLPIGPYWPRALLIMTSNGVLRLLYAGQDHKWSEDQLSVLPIALLQDRLTHAAFACINAEPNNTILVATHAANGRMTTFIVEISMPDPRTDPLLTVPPQMRIHHIKDDIRDLPLAAEDETNRFLSQEHFMDDKHTRLSHLEIVAPSDIEKTVQIPTTIFAVYTNYSYLSGMLTAWSTVKRWKVSYVEVGLHSRFEEIASHSNAVELIRHRVERMPDVQLEQAIASFTLVDHGQTIVATTLDGTISFYNPTTMQQLFFENEANEVTSMSQAQFAFPPTPSPFNAVFSTNACAAVAPAPDGSLQLSTMEHHAGIQTNSANGDLDAALAALVMTYIRPCYNSFNADDVLVCILRTINPQHYRKLVSSMSHTLFRDADFLGTDTDKLLRQPLVSKFLTFQSALGFTSATADSSSVVDGPRRDPGARYAWTTLNIRHTALLLFALLSHHKQSSSPLPAELLWNFASNARWGVSLCRLIVDELFELSDAASNSDVDNTHVKTPDSSLVQALLTGIWSRCFLRILVRFLKVALTNSTSTADPAGAVSKAIDMTQKAGLSLNGMSLILDAWDRRVGENDAETERELLLTGKVAEGAKQVIGPVIKDILPVLRSKGEIDRLWLYTTDFSGALLEHGGGGKRLDIRSKTVLASGGKDLKACVRCGSLTKGFSNAAKDWPKQIYTIVMRCPCEGTVIDMEK